MEVTRKKSSVGTGTAQKDSQSVRTIFSVFPGDHGIQGFKEMLFVTKDHGDSTGSNHTIFSASGVVQTHKKHAGKSKVICSYHVLSLPSHCLHTTKVTLTCYYEHARDQTRVTITLVRKHEFQAGSELLH